MRHPLIPGTWSVCVHVCICVSVCVQPVFALISIFACEDVWGGF